MEWLAHIDATANKLADQLEAWCSIHLETTPLFWFRTPYQHVVEAALMACLCCAMAAVWWLMKSQSPLPAAHAPRTGLDEAYAFVLAVCMLLQLYVKMFKTWADLAFLLMPCHLLTFLQIYFLLSNGGRVQRKCFNLMLYFAIFPVIAMLTPDFNDHVLAIEPYLYVVHHSLLIITPFYACTQGRRFEIQPLTVVNALEMVIIAVVVNFYVQTVAAYISGLNINYHLHPPTLPFGIFAADQFYRYKVMCLLIPLAIMTRLLVPATTRFISKRGRNDVSVKKQS